MTIPMTFRRSVAADTARPRRLAPGFSLTEILIAIALIVIIVTVAVTNLSGVLDSGKISAAQMFVKESMSTPLLSYKLAMGHYPSTDQGLDALVVCPQGENQSLWKGPYLTGTDVPLDPWKQPYHYAFPSTHGQSAGMYDLWSNGPTGQDGAQDSIGNWQTSQ
jgi:general secretion pathway protein G